MIECILICAGEGTRWNNYLGVPKHLIKINGETLIERTVKLIHKYATEPVNISIVVKDLNDKRYYVKGATTVKANLRPENLDSDKFFSSMHLWNKTGRTLVFYGDVWFSENTMKSIMEWKGKDWILFGGRDECFCQSFYPKDLDAHLDALKKVRDAHVQHKLKRCGGWEHYRQMVGIDLKIHRIKGKFCMIDDDTTDFDYPRDYDLWIKRWNK